MTDAARPTVPSDETSAARCGWCSCPLPGHALGCPNGPKPSTQVRGHGSLRRSCEICERDDEIAALRAERDALREALRKHAISDGICYQCGTVWEYLAESEQHSPGCLAAPKEEEK